MRRSFRDAIVGFSLIGGVVAFAATMLWLRGVRIRSNAWEITANFSDATGLAERSPVTYRGILVGYVDEISVNPENVQATLKIDKKDLLLPLPVFAKVVKNSLLGGDVQIALVSRGKLTYKNPPLPSSEECYKKGILCKNDQIKGEALSSISNLASEIGRIVKKAEEEDIVTNLVDSTKQFDKTQKELEELILQAKQELIRAQPTINELNSASEHLNNILAAIDNPKTLNDIQETASNTRSLSKKIDSLSGEVEKMMQDEELMNAVRNVTIGLGELFSEIYPAKTQR